MNNSDDVFEKIIKLWWEIELKKIDWEGITLFGSQIEVWSVWKWKIKKANFPIDKWTLFKTEEVSWDKRNKLEDI